MSKISLERSNSILYQVELLAYSLIINLPESLTTPAICVLATLSAVHPETDSTADSPPVWAGEEEADGLSSLRRAR